MAEAGSLDVQGFPNRFDTVFTDLVLADPATGLAWEVPQFQINALSYTPHHVIAVWPDRQLVATPQEKFLVESRDMRASLVIAPDTGSVIKFTASVSAAVNIAPDATSRSCASQPV